MQLDRPYPQCRAIPVRATVKPSALPSSRCPSRVTECNCSICAKKGILHFRVPPEAFELLSGESALGTYQFGTQVAKHHFCTTCGIQVFTRPRAAPHLYTVNVRTLDNFDLNVEQPEIVRFDGKNFEANANQLE